MLDSLRNRIYGALTDKTGDGFVPVRLVKSAVLFANDVVGRPLASAEELAERRLLEAATAARAEDGARERIVTSERAPVVVFHIERLPTELRKITDILTGEGIEFSVRSIGDDEAALSAAKMDSNGARFPMVFIAGAYVGGAEALTNMLRSGELEDRIAGR